MSSSRSTTLLGVSTGLKGFPLSCRPDGGHRTPVSSVPLKLRWSFGAVRTTSPPEDYSPSTGYGEHGCHCSEVRFPRTDETGGLGWDVLFIQGTSDPREGPVVSFLEVHAPQPEGLRGHREQEVEDPRRSEERRGGTRVDHSDFPLSAYTPPIGPATRDPRRSTCGVTEVVTTIKTKQSDRDTGWDSVFP